MVQELTRLTKTLPGNKPPRSFGPTSKALYGTSDGVDDAWEDGSFCAV